MNNKNKVFSASIYGRGRLLGLVVADGIKAFPKSRWYDYSDQMKRAVKAEHQIAKSGYMRPDGVASVKKAVANQRSPRRTDIELHFSFARDTDRVRVVAGRQVRNFSYREQPNRQTDILKTAAQIVRAIGQMA